MAQWAVLIPAERFEAERLFQHDTLTVDGTGPTPGDEALIVAGGERPVAVALGRVTSAGPTGGGRIELVYTRRSFDEPASADDLPLSGVATPVDAAAFQRVVGRFAAAAQPRRTWLVSLDLPIEAASPAEAVRQFWTYVMDLGPRELPAFVSPSGDELAMQAFVLGAAANLDPEEDEDE